jgi:hypothetical protein
VNHNIQYEPPGRRNIIDTASAAFGAAMVGGLFAILFMAGMFPNDRMLGAVCLAVFTSVVCWTLAFGADGEGR